MNPEKEILKEIDLWLTDKKISKICPECKSENLQLNNTFGIINISPLVIPPMPNPRTGLTVVVLGCLDCGFMRFFSANVMGIVPNFESTRQMNS